MRPWKAFALAYYVLALVVTLIPEYWWFVQVGGIIAVYDSPYSIDVSFLNDKLLMVDLINAALTGFRIYMAIILSYGIASVLRGREFLHSTFFAVTVFYLLEPLIFYFVEEALTAFHVINTSYSPVFFGTTTMVVKVQDSTAVMTVSFYPLKLYWFALLSAAFYPMAKVSLYLDKRGGARH